MMYLFLAATGLSFLSVFHSALLEWILNVCFPKPVNAPIRAEINAIKAELQTVSMVDEFPKYARLQRKLNALKEQLSTTPNKITVAMNRMMVDLFLQGSFVCTNLFCFYMYRSVSVFKLPAEWLEPHPIPRLVSWPSNEAGGISFLFWFTVSSQVFRLLKTR
ncbi:unnamed protein product [Bemisia tabaci]|uniref:Guided entry of tail-anchored proteins factor 1 n=1 Tax=Bemisia tabaci TaxID=7038 RepID=A0A9P0A9K1_BEMTA|nr:unnamed protein product [Bemisia tabaci]